MPVLLTRSRLRYRGSFWFPVFSLGTSRKRLAFESRATMIYMLAEISQ